MSDLSSAQGDHAGPAKKPWRWWHILLAVAGGVIVLSKLGGGSIDLEVSIPRSSGGTQLQIQNVGKKAIDITGVKINNRDECKGRTLFTLSEDDPKIWPAQLNIGDSMMLLSFCRIVRASVSTSSGAATYEFK